MERGARSVLAAGSVAVAALLVGSAAPARGASPSQADPLQVDAALVAIAREAQALVALDALEGVVDELAVALEPLGPAGPDPAGALPALDAEAASAWAPVRTAVGEPSRDTDQAGQPLGADDQAAAGRGEPISLTADVYLRALDHLVRFDGARPDAPAPPDAAAIAAAITAALAAQPPPSTPTTTGAPPPSSTATTAVVDDEPGDEQAGGADEDDGGLPLVALLAGAVLVGVVLAFLLAGRRRQEAPASRLDELLEVSRRLTAAAASGDVDRAIVRDAIGLVAAQGAVLVRRAGDRLVVGHESHAGLVVADRLDDGLVQRVAETGQPLLQVSASEPAVRNLPAALAAVPLVGGGSVNAVLLLLRDHDRPFTRDEADVLASLAPIAAAALRSANHTQAAIEDSLLDPLTGVGNRRRFDADVSAAGDALVALVLVDIDHFKAVNDRFGHPVGDAVLRTVADVLRGSVRPLDRVYRFGGEEFCILLPDAVSATGADVAERVRRAVADAPTLAGGDRDGTVVRVTASFGVAAGAADDVASVVAAADAALYRAKEGGRDRVVVA